MTAKFTVLGNTTLATASASVTFSSIPGGYKDLVFLFEGSTTFNGLGLVKLVLNSDTADVYKLVGMSGSGTSADSFSGSNNDVVVGRTKNTSKTFSQVDLMDYSATNKHTSCLIRSNIAEIQTEAKAVRYASNSAITSIQVITNATLFTAGSTFRLLGVN
jgi:hypothetical protein